MGRWGAPWQNPKLRNSDSDSTWKINKRLKTSFAGTSHKKSFHSLVSKDQGRRSSGKGGGVQNARPGPLATYDFAHMPVRRMSGECIGHPLL